MGPGQKRDMIFERSSPIDRMASHGEAEDRLEHTSDRFCRAKIWRLYQNLRPNTAYVLIIFLCCLLILQECIHDGLQTHCASDVVAWLLCRECNWEQKHKPLVRLAIS